MPFRSKLPHTYERIASVQPTSAGWIHLATQDGQRFRLCIAQQDRFRAEISEHCPHLEAKPFGVLAMPMFPNLSS
jgi:hypothetical protein